MKRWTENDEQKRLCLEWLKEPLVNPETGHPIERNGPTFLYWKEKSKQLNLSNLKSTGVMTWRKCQEWNKNREINPDTGRKIKIGSKTYKNIEKQCKCITQKNLNLLGEYFLPDCNGLVPCIINNNTKYVARKYNDRKIWGPLNKPAKGIILQYYTDTWDYKNNHYRPIFIGGKAPINNNNSCKNIVIKNSSKIHNKQNPKDLVDNFLNLFL
jgi:hypothetical protein